MPHGVIKPLVEVTKKLNVNLFLIILIIIKEIVVKLWYNHAHIMIIYADSIDYAYYMHIIFGLWLENFNAKLTIIIVSSI